MDKPIHVWETGLSPREQRVRQYYLPPTNKPQDYTQPSRHDLYMDSGHNAETPAPL